ncbi:hypothetical protein GGH95_004885, partial [Coemansia sp. RSA 1836]
QPHILPADNSNNQPSAVAMSPDFNLNQDAFAQAAAAAAAAAAVGDITSNIDSQHHPPGQRRNSTEGSRRGRARGRGRGRGVRHHNPAQSGGGGGVDQSPLRPLSPTGWTPGDAEPEDNDVIKMDDLVSRGVVAKISDLVYRIPPDVLLSARSSITIGAAVGGDKRRFNLKWLYDYHWLRFDPSENSMLCAMCKRGKRANQFAKRGSKNFKTSALVDHCLSNDHKRSLAQNGPMDLGSDPA